MLTVCLRHCTAICADRLKRNDLSPLSLDEINVGSPVNEHLIRKKL